MNMTNEPSTYPSAPAPWTTKGEMYWLLTSIRTPLSPSIYSPLEAQSLSPQVNDYKGGWAYIQIIRYTSTPVGPYDELMILPGDFFVPGGKHEGKSKLRVSRIYVSQKETTWNGELTHKSTIPIDIIASSDVLQGGRTGTFPNTSLASSSPLP